MGVCWCHGVQHPRVRFAVCQAIGQMSTDFAPPDSREAATGFQSLFHAQVRIIEEMR